MLSSRPYSDRVPQLAAIAIAAVVLGIVFQNTFSFLYVNWHREEYSHGFLIPPISAFLLWQRREWLKRLPPEGSWLGFGLVVLGLLLFFLNFFATVVGADAYALVIVIAGFALAALGWRGFRVALVPIMLLLLMNPLPTFWYNNLSSELQLLSSQLGVAIMRLFGVSVLLEGNVIDLGTYKLQVAEACSGLRYLFPLLTLGAVIAYVFKGKTWARWCIVLSTIPITVFMNSFRIGVIGVLVDRFGIAQAEGVLHQFEGWVIFMACLALLLIECRLLLSFSGDRRSLREVIGFSPPAHTPNVTTASPPARHIPVPALAAGAALVLSVYPALALPQHTEIKPARADFSVFPAHIGDWIGHRQTMERVYLDELQLDDYLLADYAPQRSAAGTGIDAPINLYVAYYASQRTGRAVHSPSSCLPGGGWRIEQFDRRVVPGLALHSGPLRVNRAVISQGTSRQLVYYWFQERGRDLTNEYAVKWYLFTDALTRDRTDGALVRVITPIAAGEDPGAADSRLRRFSAAALPALTPYLPD
jgi:exosortase D (VPLPA-CTERM-specific)